KFISLKATAGDDPMTVTLERAVELITAKIESDAAKEINIFDAEEPVIKVLNGRYGPYISIGKENVKIPKDTDPKTLTREDCLRLQAESAGKPKKVVPRRVTAKTLSKTTSTKKATSKSTSKTTAKKTTKK
ncbi:MAG: topoisomerase C-terminal repeat-containing protein, partial [Flavobacteriales bacterium]|nr:topoisomerase C-terminal repeat-containing protein [Flavobacteriales bacterium]